MGFEPVAPAASAGVPCCIIGLMPWSIEWGERPRSIDEHSPPCKLNSDGSSLTGCKDTVDRGRSAATAGACS